MIGICTNLVNTVDAFLVKRGLFYYHQPTIKSIVTISPLLIFLRRQSRWMQDRIATLLYYILCGVFTLCLMNLPK